MLATAMYMVDPHPEDEVFKDMERLAEKGLILRIPVGDGKATTLFLVEYDAEKDYFPDLLSLRMPVITRHDGEPFYSFLDIREYRVITRLRRVFMEVLGVENPRIDYVRFEVSLDPSNMPRVEAVLEDLFGWKTRAWITILEYQLASKIKYKLGKDYGPDLKYNLHDILKATLDLRLLDHVDTGKVKQYMGPVKPGIIMKNLEALLKPNAYKIWNKNYHYTLIRKNKA